jgi:hypothetical protein
MIAKHLIQSLFPYSITQFLFHFVPYSSFKPQKNKPRMQAPFLFCLTDIMIIIEYRVQLRCNKVRCIVFMNSLFYLREKLQTL